MHPDRLAGSHLHLGYEQAVLHYGEAIKAIMNEELGDGIMSAIDMFATIDKIKGKTGEDRIVITLNGKVSCMGTFVSSSSCRASHDPPPPFPPLPGPRAPSAPNKMDLITFARGQVRWRQYGLPDDA